MGPTPEKPGIAPPNCIKPGQPTIYNSNEQQLSKQDAGRPILFLNCMWLYFEIINNSNSN